MEKAKTNKTQRKWSHNREGSRPDRREFELIIRKMKQFHRISYRTHRKLYKNFGGIHLFFFFLFWPLFFGHSLIILKFRYVKRRRNTGPNETIQEIRTEGIVGKLKTLNTNKNWKRGGGARRMNFLPVCLFLFYFFLMGGVCGWGSEQKKVGRGPISFPFNLISGIGAWRPPAPSPAVGYPLDLGQSKTEDAAVRACRPGASAGRDRSTAMRTK